MFLLLNFYFDDVTNFVIAASGKSVQVSDTTAAK